MNSYPPELLAQLAPVMFAAGLDVPATPSTPNARSQDPFTVLMMRLRDTLSEQRKVSIWQPEKSTMFQVLIVDRVSAGLIIP
jgi:hypothetical protein